MNELLLDVISYALNQYNVKELSGQFLELAKKSLKGNKGLSFKMGLKESSYEYFLTAKKFNKNDLVALCLFPFSTKELYQEWCANLDEEVRAVWELMLWEEKLDETAILEKTGIKISNGVSRSNFGGYRGKISDYVKDKFHLFKIFNGGYWNQPKISIATFPELREILVGYYDLPENAQIVTNEKPEKTDFIFENADQVLLSELARIYLYKSQKNIALTSKERPKHTTIPKMQKSLNLKEFFPNDKDKKLKHLRTNLVAGIIALINSRNQLEDPVSFIKNKMFFDTFLEKAHTAASVLSDLKGMGYIDGYDLKDIELDIITVIKEFPEGWIPFDRIWKHFKFNLIGLTPISKYKASDKLHYDYIDEEEDAGFYRDNKHFIDDGRYEKSISKPYLKGFFFLLSSLGMFDLAYNRADRTKVGLTCQSAYDELKYVKLTPLGAFILDIKEGYEVAESIGKTSFVFSPEALTITLDGTDVSAGFVLEPYASRVGPNRFATDSSIFLKDIKSKNALKQRISLFRQVTKVKIPQNWEDFFTDLLEKVDPFQSINDQFIIYKLPESNKNLIKLIAQDRLLKSYSFKAEGYHLMVQKSKNSAFKKRLLEFGYLIT